MRTIFDVKSFLIPTLLIAVIYLILVAFLMNLGLVQDTIFGEHTIQYRINLLLALILGLGTTMTGLGLSILLLISLLTGANITLITKRLKNLKAAGNLHMVVGGSSLLGIVGSGCATCGLPVLSVLGITGSFSSLPFRGEEFTYISVFLLLISLYFMIKSNYQAKVCEIRAGGKLI